MAGLGIFTHCTKIWLLLWAYSAKNWIYNDEQNRHGPCHGFKIECRGRPIRKEVAVEGSGSKHGLGYHTVCIQWHARGKSGHRKNVAQFLRNINLSRRFRQSKVIITGY